ncbi:tumor protein d54, partial [Biomphalaria glabrata]
YQKTSAVVKTASEKTTSAINSMGQAVARKLSNVKNSQTFKSFDEKVHTTYATVK